jgi:phosphoserine phosphatase RsbU/P
MFPPVLLAVGPPADTQRLRSTLEPCGFGIEEATGERVPADLSRYSAAVIAGPDTLTIGRRLGGRSIDERPLLLYFAPDNSTSHRLAGFAHGADAVISATSGVDEIEAQLRVFERWHVARSRWRERANEASHATQQLQIAYRQIDLDLALARRLQASFLPRTLPAVGAIRFGVSYRPCGQVGGDFYDVIRLDEHHVGFYVADAMGHGVPASLLTIFLKKAVQPKDVSAASYRLVPPEEVLARLNRDLIAQGLAELPFITMIYGLLDCETGDLQLARAAHPHPVYLPRLGEPEQWQTPGTLLGIFEAEYPPLRRELKPGDKLLLYTDGLSESGHEPAPIIAAALDHRSLPIQSLVERTSDCVLKEAPQPDDFTLLGVEMLI